MKQLAYIWLLCFECLVTFSQQGFQQKTQINVFVQDTTVNPIHTGYWLIKLKNSADVNILFNSTCKIVRQISPTDFIIQYDNTFEKKLPEKIIYALKANNNWKLSPYLLSALENTTIKNKIYSYQIQSNNVDLLKRLIVENHSNILITYQYNNTIIVSATPKQINNFMLPNKTVIFIGIANQAAKEETTIYALDNSANTINKLHSIYSNFNGKSTFVSVKENLPDTMDIDFKGRFISTTEHSNNLSSHATIMSTIITGAGNNFYTAKGVAWASSLTSANFETLLPNTDAFYKQYSIGVQNHSYGTGIENFYGADAAAYDETVNNNPSLLHVFSSGNIGNRSSTVGNYNGIKGFANLTGSFKMAKNVITVGSIDSFYTVPLLSSKGPTYDGRLKPELVAFGEDGSSGAAALVSGTALVLQQIYKEQYNNTLPNAGLVKAILLNTADDVGTDHIDFSSGFGKLNAWRAAKTMVAKQFFSGTVTQNQLAAYTLSIPANAKNLKILLTWVDKPAIPNAFSALINDLDVSVKHTTSASSWQPWVLNSMPNRDSLLLLPVRKRDSLNNVEQITIADPLPGDYAITVHGFSIPSGTQPFFIAYQWDTTNMLEWTFPTKNDNLLPLHEHVLRWQHTHTLPALLEYSIAGSNNWKTIYTAVDMGKGYCKWITPDTNAVALLRITTSNGAYISDTFTISAKLQPAVGFNCLQEALLYWNKGFTNNYTLFALGSQYLQPFTSLTDTSILLNKATEKATWYAVATVLPFNKTGIKSFAFDYTQQGVGCYVKSFTADLVNNAGQIQVTLASKYKIMRLTIEKILANGTAVSLLSVSSFTGLQHSITDFNLTTGLNVYRIKTELDNGKIIYSNKENLYFFGNKKYVAYPNPVQQRQSFSILSASLNNFTIDFFTIYGQKVFSKKSFTLVEQIPANIFAKGVYFYVIKKEGVVDEKGKLVVE